MTGRAPALAVLALVAAGCAMAPPGPGAPVPGTAALLAGGPLTGGADVPPLPDVDVLALDDDLRRFLAARVPARGPDAYRLRLLLEALIHDEAIAVAGPQDPCLAGFHPVGPRKVQGTSKWIEVAAINRVPALPAAGT